MDPHVLMHMRDVFQERLGSHVSHCVFGTVNVAGQMSQGSSSAPERSSRISKWELISKRRRAFNGRMKHSEDASPH